MDERAIKGFVKLVKFDPHGFVPAVVQDDVDGTVLMVAYMNAESLMITLREDRCCFWSRSRRSLWRKGESSGNVQIIKKISIDCDGDCILVRVEQKGEAACHTGYRSCFFRSIGAGGTVVTEGKPLFDPDDKYGKK